MNIRLIGYDAAAAGVLTRDVGILGALDAPGGTIVEVEGYDPAAAGVIAVRRDADEFRKLLIVGR